MKTKYILILVLLLAVIAGYDNCGGKSAVSFSKSYGTIAPNPLVPTQSSAELLFTICSVINRCNPQVTYESCEQGVLGDPINSQIGAPASYTSFSSVMQAEQSGVLVGNQGATDTCAGLINNLSCSSPSVINAYNPSNSNSFAGVPNMIPTQSCAEVFSSNYEYLYLGDSDNKSILGYSVNTSSGVLSPISNPPSAVGGYLSLGKISGNTQVLAAESGAYLIDPTTGILNLVTGSGFLAGNPAAFSPSGLFVYAVAGGGRNAWSASVNPTTGNFSGATETANFSAPITRAYYTQVSPDGNYVYFMDNSNNAITGYSTQGSALAPIAGTSVGTGINPGDQTYGLTQLPSPNAGKYDVYSPPQLDAGAGVIYLKYTGATSADDNWLMPYKINGDGSLSTGTPLNMGPNPLRMVTNTMVGDSSGKYLFVAGINGIYGITTYTIGSNGTLTYSSGPVFAGVGFSNLLINSENSLIYANASSLVTASLNLATGVLTPLSNLTNPCNASGPMALDVRENFIYTISYGIPNSICGFQLSSSGAIAPISGQSYPLTIPGSQQIISIIAVQGSPF